jgi:hypothetical protein
MYAIEKLDNFRWIFNLLAKKSPHTLSSADLVDPALQNEVAEIGQYTIIAYSRLPLDFVFENLEMLRQKDFPLEGYEPVPDAVLVSSFRSVPGFLIYLPSRHRLLLSFAGTSNLKQAWYDVRTMHHPYPPRERCTVHTGFWLLYQSVRTPALHAIQVALAERDVHELVVTGHSMGGALAYLFAIEIMTHRVLPSGIAIKVAAYGVPRVGNLQLQQHWRDVVNDFRTKNGDSSIEVYSVKAYNDGD